MKILQKDELLIAEGVLMKHIPKSLKVYGFLYGINRNKPTPLQVIVDTWPDFKVIICRPDPEVSSHLAVILKSFTMLSVCSMPRNVYFTGQAFSGVDEKGDIL